LKRARQFSQAIADVSSTTPCSPTSRTIDRFLRQIHERAAAQERGPQGRDEGRDRNLAQTTLDEEEEEPGQYRPGAIETSNSGH